MRELTPKQELFCRYVAAGQKLAHAYRSAGYKGKRQSASRLMSKVNVASRVKELQERSLEKSERTQQEVISGIWDIVGDPKTSPNLRLRALAELAKCYGLNTQRIEHTHQQGDVLSAIESIVDSLPADVQGDARRTLRRDCGLEDETVH